MTTPAIERFEPGLAQPLTELIHSAFAVAAAHARPRDTAAFIANMLGSANPAGTSWIGYAHDDEGMLGALSGIPFRFRTLENKTVTGYQLGYFAVHPRYTGRLLGKRLMTMLIPKLLETDDAFVYGFPNTRSAGILSRCGMRPIERAWTCICLPTALSVAGLRKAQAAGHCVDWILPDQAGSIADELNSTSDAPGLIREAEYFRWRYCGPDSDERYRFCLVTKPDGRHDSILVMTTHRVDGRTFAILVEVLTTRDGISLSKAITIARAMTPRLGASLLYLTTNQIGSRNLATLVRNFGLPVPERFNARPVVFYWTPSKSAVSEAELSSYPIMTGDWMGF